MDQNKESEKHHQIPDSSNPENKELTDFCTEIDQTIKKAETFIDKSYASNSKSHKRLEKILRNYVRKLHSLQIEMRTTFDNITSLKAKIRAVKSNLEDHRKQSKALKKEEERQTQNLASLTPKRSEIPLPTTRRPFDPLPSLPKSPKVTFGGSQARKPRPTRRKFLTSNFSKSSESGVTLLLHPLDNEDFSQSQYENIPEETPSMSKIEASIPDIEPETTRTPTPIPSLASISWRSTRMSVQSSGTNNSISSSRQGFFPMNFDDPDDID